MSCKITSAQRKRAAREAVITALCNEEGGKRQALDAGQAREVLAKLRKVLIEMRSIDLYSIIYDEGMHCARGGEAGYEIPYTFRTKGR